MLVIPGAWELASLTCKLFLYIGITSVGGGGLCLWLYGEGSKQSFHRILGYIIIGDLLGFLAVVANFLIQVGMVNLDGLAGMFDWGMIALLMDTPLGESSMARFLGFGLILVASLAMLLISSQRMRLPTAIFYRRLLAIQNFYRLLVVIHLLGLFCIAYSFLLGGHISVLGAVSQVAVTLHLVTLSMWLGSLYPLYQLTTGNMSFEMLQHTMRRFGDGIIIIVCILLLTGVLMLFELITSPLQLLQTSYGNALLLKLTLGLSMLLIAALNKLYLVPTITAQNSVAGLRLSIRIEAIVATAILAVTSYLSTIIGPPG